MIHINFNFLSSNVKEMKSSKKRLNQFEYFKRKLKPSGLAFYGNQDIALKKSCPTKKDQSLF